jgi:O-methyltransferase
VLKDRTSLVQILRRLPSVLVTIILLPVVAGRYFRSETGRGYGVSLFDKLRLLMSIVRNNALVPTASNFVYHLLMAAAILNVPRETEGVIVECGCYKGGSAVNLSLIAAMCGRELHLFDSFAGLPSPSPTDEGHLLVVDQEVRTYAAGAYAGTLEEVTHNVERYGALGSCTFHEGFFEETLPKFDCNVVFAYLDVDLAASEETCLRHLWPLLIEDGYLFTDEAPHLEIAAQFFDRQWWQSEFGAEPPGLVGAGNGLGLFLREGGFSSSIGYTIKLTRERLDREPG